MGGEVVHGTIRFVEMRLRENSQFFLPQTRRKDDFYHHRRFQQHTIPGGIALYKLIRSHLIQNRSKTEKQM